MESVGNQGFTVLSQNNLQHSTSENLGTDMFLRSPFGTMFYQGFCIFFVMHRTEQLAGLGPSKQLICHKMDDLSQYVFDLFHTVPQKKYNKTNVTVDSGSLDIPTSMPVKFNSICRCMELCYISFINEFSQPLSIFQIQRTKWK